MGKHAKKAEEFFLAGANCAQAVAGAFAEDCGISLERMFQAASGFGAGVARMREICGAVSGMVLVADFLRGNADIHDKAAKDAHYKFVRELTDAFQKETGSVVCRELLGLTPHQNDGTVSETRTSSYYKKRPCSEMVVLAAKILEQKFFPDCL